MLNLTEPAKRDGTPLYSEAKTPTFGFPLEPGATCGDCAEWKPINPGAAVGRCRPKCRPGYICPSVAACSRFVPSKNG